MNAEMPVDLATLFFGTYRRQVLALLLRNPDQAYHLRQIARLTGTQPGTLRRELAKLVGASVLRSERVGNLVQYQADAGCPIYAELRSILEKTTAPVEAGHINIGSGIQVDRAALHALARKYHIKHLALFGSAARGELTPQSDIDLLVEFEPGAAPSLGGLVGLREALEKQFGRRVDLATPSILNNPYRRRAIEKDMKDMEELYAA